MDDDRPVLRLWVLVHDLAHAPPELQERVGEGVGVTGPLRVVELDHLPLLPLLPQPREDLVVAQEWVARYVPKLGRPEEPWATSTRKSLKLGS